jgi:hypothetical protein
VNGTDLDMVCRNAVNRSQYEVITNLIETDRIDPNALVDPVKRIGGGIYKVSCTYDDDLKRLIWYLPQYVDEDAHSEKSTLLHQAIALRKKALIDAILKSSKTDVNQKSEAGYTSLHYAVLTSDVATVKKLLQRGAEIHITCNGFTAYDMARAQEIRDLLHPTLAMRLFLPYLPLNLTKPLNRIQQHINLDDSSLPGSGQYGILSKMKAMREGDEVKYGNSTGVCCGVAHAAMFYLLSQKRDESACLIGKQKLNEILLNIAILSTEDFLQKMSTEKQMFLEYRPFLDNVELLQEIDWHPELFKQTSPIEFQYPSAAHALLMTPELESLGGFSKEIRFSGAFLQDETENKNELSVLFNLLHDYFKRLSFPATLQLTANGHAISVTYDPKLSEWILVDINIVSREGIFSCSEFDKIGKKVYDCLKFGHSGKQGNQLLKPWLILTIELLTARQYESDLVEQFKALQKDQRFEALRKVTSKKASLTDNVDRTWLQLAVYAGDMEAFRRLQEYNQDKSYVSLCLHRLQIYQKYRQQYNNYFQSSDSQKTFSFRARLINLTGFKLRKSAKETALKFIVEILDETPLADNAEEDEINLHQATLNHYARWIYQGRDPSALLAEPLLKTLMQPILEHSTFIQTLNQIYQYDKPLVIQIRGAIHELENTSPIDEVSIRFLSECLTTAGRIATTNALNHIIIKVIDTAISQTTLSFQYPNDTHQEKIHSMVKTRFFSVENKSDPQDLKKNFGAKKN